MTAWCVVLDPCDMPTEVVGPFSTRAEAEEAAAVIYGDGDHGVAVVPLQCPKGAFSIEVVAVRDVDGRKVLRHVVPDPEGRIDTPDGRVAGFWFTLLDGKTPYAPLANNWTDMEVDGQ